MIISEILTWEVIDNHHPIVIIDALILSDLRQLDLQAGIVKAELVQRLNGPLLPPLDAGQGVLNGLDLPQLTPGILSDRSYAPSQCQTSG